MEVLGSVVAELVKGIWAPIAQCWTNHKNIHANMEKLEEKTEELNSRKEDIDRRLRNELRPGKRIRSEVELWLKNERKISKEVETLKEEVGRVNFVLRAKVSNCVVAKLQEVEELHEKGVFTNEGLVVDSQIPNKFPLVKIFGESTAMKIAEEIWAYLMGDEIHKIGLYGMGGSGKTTVMQQVYNKLLEEKDRVGPVIWVTVSKAFDVHSLQLYIARAFELDDFSKIEEESNRVRYLYSMLEQKGRFVLILDDLWEAFPLHKVGIPKPTSTNKCKLVLTTRSRDVCAKMECKAIEMALLSRDEARDLFLNTVGDDITLSSNIKDVACQVADECSRLPLAVITIARSMKGKTDLFEWRSALAELRSMRHEDMKNQVLKQLEFSYSRLKDDRLKKCLLFCALYPEDYEIERNELVDNIINDGIIEGLDSIQEEIDKGHSLLNEVVKACLLEDSQGWYGEQQCVKMHDLIREMAIQKMNENAQICLVKSGENLTEVPNDDCWTLELEKASLMNNYIEEIASNHAPMCSKLTTLMLGENPLVSIANSFFTHMNGLTFLDLSDTEIKRLPNSLSDLVNLTVMLLQHCSTLTHIPSLAKLTSLKKLDISYTISLRNRPEGSEMLTNLRSLDLTETGLQDFPVTNMTQLALLRSGQIKRKVEEVTCLKKLEILVCFFLSLDEYTTYCKERHNKHLYMYYIGVCEFARKEVFEAIIFGNYFKADKRVDLDLSNFNEQGPLMIPKDVQWLNISSAKNLKNLSDISLFDMANDLKQIVLKSCRSLQCLFNLSSASHHVIPTTTVVTLALAYLSNLRSLVAIDDRSAVTTPSTIRLPIFNQLKSLSIRGCPNIKEAFPYRALWTLQNLETIRIFGCKSLEQIIATGDQEKPIVDSAISSNRHAPQPACLPNLKELNLQGLPELKSIFPDGVNIDINAFYEIWIIHCPKLKRIPISLPVDENGEPTVPSSFEGLYIGPREHWLSLEWDHPNTKNVLEKRFPHLLSSNSE